MFKFVSFMLTSLRGVANAAMVVHNNPAYMNTTNDNIEARKMSMLKKKPIKKNIVQKATPMPKRFFQSVAKVCPVKVGLVTTISKTKIQTTS